VASWSVVPWHRLVKLISAPDGDPACLSIKTSAAALGKTLIPTSRESTQTTESWDAAFRAHSCSGENDEAVGGGDGEVTRTFRTEFRAFNRLRVLETTEEVWNSWS
jgi:hypothetical protein